ncbi:putative eukaryotic initiation factor-4E [Cardiosporidium cionae]|uniref:Eukaryotic initiation factor-4E n=1 Tax=Cardiosporidium cionae TaxID=476202 RepID=A0ABQ7JAQ6_9APIC|nr:putative eukaryotic initiation factor-4E [Cardiosporidium cionae]|eukprot:KAF8821009.1 putative eukaryotic initiation factor-4E [Cardiosporidium cionae]
MSSTRFLSFNSNIPEKEDLEKLLSQEENPDTSMPLPLRYTWKLWEQVELGLKRGTAKHYSNNTKELATFSTVQEFWEIWNQLPQPSALLMQKRMIRKDKNGLQQEVDGLMIFKDGVSPMWEDPANKCGGHLEFKFLAHMIGKGQIDEYWNNLVLALIGDTLECGDLITGVRMVDKLNVVKNGFLRIEVWYTACSEAESLSTFAKGICKTMAAKIDGSIGILPHYEEKRH